jgi:hypothetical protein
VVKAVFCTSELTARRVPLDRSENALGQLRAANEHLADPPALQARMTEDGYLFLRDYLDRDQVRDARVEITARLAAQGLLDANCPPLEAITHAGISLRGQHSLAADNPPLEKLLYTGRMMELFTRFLGGPVRHYDYTWFRAVPGGGEGTYPHCDVVYMGRGTFNLYTAWTPIGDVSLELGGLMILEGSHRRTDKLRDYLARDVDTYCTNRADAGQIESGEKLWQDWDGRLEDDPEQLRKVLGGRWLTTDFHAGDVLIFGMATVHASLDNHSRAFRLSSDSRYQLASEPVDERWIGVRPIGHGPAGKKGMIC